MKITYSKGRGTKIHINIDGEYRFTTDVDFWFSSGIHSGDEISAEELDSLEEQINIRKAYNKGIDLLSRRAHSKKELIDKIKRTVDEKYAIIAVDKLEERGYVNDSEFARAYYRYLYEGKHYAKKRIFYELYLKGISRDTAESVAYEFEDDPVQSAKDLIGKKYLRYLADEKGRRKVFNALVRLGYSYSDIRSAMSEYNED